MEGGSLAVGVLTHPSHTGRRAAIRETWAAACIPEGRVLGVAVRLRFIVGRSSLLTHLPELRSSGDLLVLPAVQESWSVLHKTLAWIRVAMEWRPRWVACVDDDAYVRLTLVLSDLLRLAQRNYSRVMYGPLEWFAFDRKTGILGPWGKNVGHAARSWRAANATARGGGQLTPPFPFLKGPLMVFDAAVSRHLLSGACGFPDAYASPMPSHARGRGRVLHDIAIGYHLSTCPPAKGVTVLDIGVATPAWRTTSSKSAPTGGGFLELRPRLDLEVGLAGCLRGVHFGSGPISIKQRECAGECAPGEALRRCLHVMHAHARVRPGNVTRLRCSGADTSWFNKSRGLVRNYTGWSYCHLQKIAFCETGRFLAPYHSATKQRMKC
ncbi:hypothetical protein AB1Y20_009163 [Prymnesium parvum]|uniref:Hexosyltransferase n=1 Tax=Prymnesium parvum TaxID=97485 RepID=A0AB34JZX4_PRYPA